MRGKPPIPWYYWPAWLLTLAAGLFVFYVLFTPVWIGIRLVSWFAERRNHAAAGAGDASDPSGAGRGSG
ncbi:MAG: hypothetical protein ACRDNI_05035 [Gaiellaceae bacterium]